jgi:uncharacterized protein (DUF2384 family)
MTIAYAETPPGRSAAGTGAAFYAPTLLDANEFEADKKRTHIVPTFIDPVLREVLEAFQDTLVHQLAGMATRVSLASRQRQTAPLLTYGTLTSWPGQMPARHWLPSNYASLFEGATLTDIDATTGYLTVHVTPAWNAETIGIVANNMVTISQVTNAAITMSGLSSMSAGSWVDFLPVTANFDRLVEQATSRPPAVPLTVRAVEDIADWFGVPAADVFKATGISKRTYQDWKRNRTRRPRSSSEGRLWELHQVAADLVETMGLIGIRHWISQDPARRKLLRAGQIDKFASQAYASLATTDRRPAWVGTGSPENHVAPRRNITLDQMDPSDVVEPGL